MDNKLQEWTAPRLMRLNHAEGTEKHIAGTEGVTFVPGYQTINGGCASPGSLDFFGGGGVAVACGPS